MLAELDAFFRAHQQPLLALYAASLLLTLLAFVIILWRWSRFRERMPAPGTDILHRGGLPPGLAIVVGLLFLLLFLPFMVDNLKVLDRFLLHNPGAWFLGIFPLIGFSLIGYGVRLLWRGRRHRERLVITQAHLSPGGGVTGEFRIHKVRKAGSRARVHLVLQEAHVFRWPGGERQLFQHSVWSDSQEAPVRVRGEQRIIPFQFRLPGRLPEQGSRWQRREWLVVLELPGHGRSVRVLHAEKGEGSFGKRLSLKDLWEKRTPVQPTLQGTPYHPFAMDVPGRNPLLELGASLFVALFPWLFWFAMDAAEQPWTHLGTSLPPILLQGAVALCLFCTLLFALLRWALPDTDEHDLPDLGRKWQRLARIGLPVVLVGDAVFLALGAWYLMDAGWQGFNPDAIERVLIHGFVGMFLWTGALALVLTVVSLLRGSSRPRPIRNQRLG